MKTDSACNIQWQKAFGGTEDETAREVYETTDGGFIIIGEGSSIDGDMFDNTNGTAYEFWVVKVDINGNLQWQNSIGGYGHEMGTSVIQLPDGRYVISGFAGGIDHDIQCSIGSYDFWMVYLDTLGSIQNQKCLGGTSADEFSQMHPTGDGGYFVTGTTLSNDVDVSGLHGVMDAWLAKVDSLGNVEWQNCLGGYSWENGFTLDKTMDEGVIVAGRTNSNDSIISSHGFFDYYVAKTDSIGVLEWSMALGGTNDDVARSVIQCRDGGFIVAGYTESFNGDVTYNHGARDFWVVKLAPLGLDISETGSQSDFITYFDEGGDLHLTFYSSKSSKMEIQLIDMAGRLISKQELKTISGHNNHEIELMNIIPGVYFISISNDGNRYVKKVIK